MRRGISFIIQSTEDEEKVIKAVMETLSLRIDEGRISMKRLEGHYKNPLTYVEIPLRREELSRVYKKVIDGLNSLDRRMLREHLGDYMDEKGRLYLRLDKQLLCLGRISLSQSDAVRIVLKPSKKELEALTGEG